MSAANKEAKPKRGGLTFRDVVNRFLAATDFAVERGEKKPITAEGYRRFLLPGAEAFGQHPVAALKPHHVSAWLDATREKPWTRPPGTTPSRPSRRA